VIDRGTVTLLSRNGTDITRTFTEITAALAEAMRNRRAVLDGEIVALGEAGVPSFSRLQCRWPQNRRPNAALLGRVPVRFYAFDVLSLDSRDITRQPYVARREHLTEIASACSSRTVQFPANWTHTDPAVVLAASAELGLEGIVCKHLESRYTAGLRSRDWIKTTHRQRSEFLIGGWLPVWGRTAAQWGRFSSAPTRMAHCNFVESSVPA
jgi:bifunctional non-homologous end joining protein LigD